MIILFLVIPIIISIIVLFLIELNKENIAFLISGLSLFFSFISLLLVIVLLETLEKSELKRQKKSQRYLNGNEAINDLINSLEIILESSIYQTEDRIEKKEIIKSLNNITETFIILEKSDSHSNLKTFKGDIKILVDIINKGKLKTKFRKSGKKLWVDIPDDLVDELLEKVSLLKSELEIFDDKK